MLLKYFTPEPRFPEPKKLAPSNGHPKEPSLVPSSNDVQPEPHSSYKVFKKGAYLETDHGKRIQILEYHPNDQDEVRRAYLVNVPCKIKLTEYESTNIGGRERSFQYSWHEEYDWLEYSVEKDVVFCLPCYVCYNGTSNSAFVVTGFKGWNLKHKLDKHVGEKPNSHHKKCVKACEDLMKKKQSIEFSYAKYSSKEEVDYLSRLKASLEAVKYLVRGGLAFRAHNEGENSIYKGHFLEFVEALGRNSEKIAAAITSGGGNCKMTSPIIQKELANACAVETIKKIVGEIGDGFFCVLVDESGDCSERFIGIVHVEDISATSLKGALECLLSGFGLCISKIRGQWYDGASNMRGRFGGLKTLIQKQNTQAYYVHCFAHQLQLALVSMARKHEDVDWFSCEVSRIVTFLRSSNKRQALLRNKQVAHFANLIEKELVETSTGLNQELSIARAGDTRWGSHFRTLNRLVDLFTPIIEVFEDLKSDSHSKGEPKSLLLVMQTFSFVFMLHLMVEILSLTNNLSQSLQKGDQDIVHAMELVQICKKKLQEFRDDGWETLYEQVVASCGNVEIDVPDMESRYVKDKKSKRLAPFVTKFHYFKNDCFLHVIDVVLKELNDRFTPENIELINCVACLSPCYSFESFDVKSLVRLARLTLVRTKKHKTFRFVYTLVKLALSLPVATLSVERVFSGMKYVKNELQSRMANPWLNDCLVTFVEKEVFNTINDMDIIKRFQGMNKRRMHLRLD
ncbi:uncharacterized protein LOC131650364 [Vicia villosa]|uniref:uncharacterized protein LOC131650364 n=1 Tax=Vicia villosa TaxID=3911 RepID=UPI00273B92A8|nr:uncharacterized protein LOC131650364 [Vicia villosa]